MVEPRGNLSLNLPHYNLSSRMSIDEKIEINKELISRLLNLVNPQKISEFRLDDLKNLSNNFSTLLKVKKISLSDQEKVFCSSCNNFKSTELSCGCFSCPHLNNQILLQIDDIFNNPNDDTLQNLENIRCPECSEPLSQAILMKIDQNFKVKISMFKTWLVENQANNQNRFICYKCKKFRSLTLLAHNVLECLHMCKFCISQQYLESKKRVCVECQAECRVEKLSLMQENCSGCKGIFYFMGDRMVEINPGDLYCCHCVSEIITNGKCDQTNDLNEKRNILKYIYVQCAQCENEVFYSQTKKDKITKSYYCAQCA